MKVSKGQKLIAIRYSDFLQANCMELHIEKMKEIGYCWFGKIGKNHHNNF